MTNEKINERFDTIDVLLAELKELINKPSIREELELNEEVEVSNE